MGKTITPSFRAKAFSCMHCGVLTTQSWVQLRAGLGVSSTGTPWWACDCDHCGKSSYWYQQQLLVPDTLTVPAAHEDFPAGPKADYDEARSIAGRSPKAAAALLRLCLQKLLVELGERGANINDDIGSLVRKGLPAFVQQALDFCRVVGNNAVHPGEIVIDDTPDVATALFEMLNVIIEHRIAIPRRIAEQFALLPEGARQAIERRDSASVPRIASTGIPTAEALTAPPANDVAQGE